MLDLVGNPEDRFSRVAAQLVIGSDHHFDCFRCIYLTNLRHAVKGATTLGPCYQRRSHTKHTDGVAMLSDKYNECEKHCIYLFSFLVGFNWSYAENCLR